MRARIICWTVICFLGSVSCIDQIELDFTGEDTFLVIEGKITNQSGPYTVRITNSARLNTDERDFPDPITGAEVYLLSDAGERVMMPERESGTYSTEGDEILGSPGVSYHIEVTLSDGRRYQSVPEALLPVASIDSLSFISLIEDRLNELENTVSVRLIRIMVSTQIPEDPENAFLRWQVSGEYEFEELAPLFLEEAIEVCYVKDRDIDNGQIIIGSGINLLGRPLDQFQIFEQKVDFRFAHTYGYEVFQQSLTASAYEYLARIDRIRNPEGGLFDSPPGRVRGNVFSVDNFEEEVLGYFFASSQTSARLFVDDEDVGNPLSPCEANTIDPVFQEACQTCTSLENSTTIKPPYWP